MPQPKMTATRRIGSLRRKSSASSTVMLDDDEDTRNSALTGVNELLDQLRASTTPEEDGLDTQMSEADMIAQVKLEGKRRQETLRLQLKIKAAKMYKLTEAEGDCLSRLAAIDMAVATYQRLSVSGRPERLGTLSERVRLQSGIYGFGNEVFEDESSESDDDCEERESITSPLQSKLEGTPSISSPTQKVTVRTRKSVTASPRTTRKSFAPRLSSASDEVSQAELARRRRLSTTTTATRPSDVVGNRPLKIMRSTPGESLGFILKTAKVAKLDAEGLPTGVYVDPTFVDDVDPSGLGYRSGLRAGDHILEIDGINCQLLKHDFVVRHLQRNDGTIQMIVRYTHDYRRWVLHRRLVTRQTKLAQKTEELERIEAQMAQILLVSAEKFDASHTIGSPMSTTSTTSTTSTPQPSSLLSSSSSSSSLSSLSLMNESNRPTVEGATVTSTTPRTTTTTTTSTTTSPTTVIPSISVPTHTLPLLSSKTNTTTAPSPTTTTTIPRTLPKTPTETPPKILSTKSSSATSTTATMPSSSTPPPTTTPPPPPSSTATPTTSSSTPTTPSTSEDLCTVDITDPRSVWQGDLINLVLNMQKQWQRERKQWQRSQSKTHTSPSRGGRVGALSVPVTQTSPSTTTTSTTPTTTTATNTTTTSSPHSSLRNRVQSQSETVVGFGDIVFTDEDGTDSDADVDDVDDGDDNDVDDGGDDDNDDDEDGDVSEALVQHLVRRVTMGSDMETVKRRQRTPSTQSIEVARRTSIIGGRAVLALDPTDDDTDDTLPGGTTETHPPTSAHRSKIPVSISVPMPNFPAPDLVLEPAVSPPHFPAPTLPPSPRLTTKKKTKKTTSNLK